MSGLNETITGSVNPLMTDPPTVAEITGEFAALYEPVLFSFTVRLGDWNNAGSANVVNEHLTLSPVLMMSPISDGSAMRASGSPSSSSSTTDSFPTISWKASEASLSEPSLTVSEAERPDRSVSGESSIICSIQ